MHKKFTSVKMYEKLRNFLTTFSFLAVSLILTSCNPSLYRTDEHGGRFKLSRLDSRNSATARVAVLLPMSGKGNASEIALSMRRAAELALSESDRPNIQLIFKDTGNSSQTAAAAARQAINEGVEMIIGPLFSHAVSAVGPIARRANVPVIAFSTDSNVAGNGVYLLSFLPQDNLTQIITYATSRKKRNFAALIPDNVYGTLTEAVLRQAAASWRAAVVKIEKYPGESEETVLEKIDGTIENLSEIMREQAVDVLLIPDEPKKISLIAPFLAQHEIGSDNVQLLGSGQWDDPSIRHIPDLAGAWYAAPDPGKWNDFSFRYRQRFGFIPQRLASLSHDAVSLAVILARQPGGNRFTAENLTRRSGFKGLDGIFRFTADGLNQRGLAILEVQQDDEPKIIQPAPRVFSK